ncbi:hypothetical protein D9C73_004949 [Collichthys lucidus]|uniref:Uncharacterized protein n=1 Tax=Collichthys lucidus TaxID=240159 RepID=A0A4U5UB87_COLLU|nr:hypothetical protein D9C73_004949 [Collichthys lucidus]
MTRPSSTPPATVAKHVARRQSNTTHLCVFAGRAEPGAETHLTMQEKRKTWNSSRFRREHMTFWSKSDPVMFPHLQTDHWSKMKTMVPVYLASVPAALLKDRVYESHEGTLNCTNATGSSSLLPPLTETAVNGLSAVSANSMLQNTQKISPQNMLQYRNVFNDRARMNFCYWLVERKGTKCKGHSFGAYKTSLGLPKV